MPPSYGTTARYALRKLLGTNLISDIDAGIGALADDVDGKMVGYSEGPFSSRPTSTGGTPGLKGRIYRATDFDPDKLYIDNGTGWDEVAASGAPASGKSIIATEEARSSSSYGLLTTPDRVSGIVLPTDGLIQVFYQAMWKESVEDQALAAIFLGVTQLKRARLATAPQDQEAKVTDRTVDTYASIFTSPAGLEPDSQRASAGSAGAYTGDATTGQVIGGVVGMTSGGAASESVAAGGPCTIFAAAGTYDISVQFRAVTGTVTAKNRKLWVRTLAF